MPNNASTKSRRKIRSHLSSRRFLRAKGRLVATDGLVESTAPPYPFADLATLSAGGGLAGWPQTARPVGKCGTGWIELF
jgi:hypothetical protein